MKVMIWLVFLGMTSCTNPSADKSLSAKTISDTLISNSQELKSSITDSVTIDKKELEIIYTQAIAVFLQTSTIYNKITYDTLYFGKHKYGQADDFPNIELPEMIENTHIRLITPELGQKLQAQRKSLVYVNMMGWVDSTRAEFLLVVFSNGTKHQMDYYIDFTFRASGNKFELNKIEVENFSQPKGQLSKRITIYKNGKYLNK